MSSVPKTKKIASLAKLLQKRFKGLPLPSERTVLEHLVYAALLENASFGQADAAYAVLENYFIDWNEIRVSTVRELADTFSMLPDPPAAGDRVRRVLQGVFEKTYMFDLEELRKKGKNLGQALEFLRGIPSCTRFMIDYTGQIAFGGHCIPLDEASLRVFRLLGLAQVNKEGTVEEVPGLERAVAKKDGINFFTQLHHFATGFFNEPLSVDLRNILKPIDSEALNRDWTPPILVVPKAAPKPSLVRPPAPVAVPVLPDDDEFEEEAAGTEAEFLPDESPYRPNERETPSRDDGETPSPTSGSVKNKEKKKPGTAPKPSAPPIAKPVAAKPSVPPVAKPPAPSEQAKAKTPKSVKEVAKPAPPAKQPVKKPPKQQEEKKPVVSIPVKKSEPKKEVAKPKTPPVKKPPVKEPPKKTPSKSAPPVSKQPPPPKNTKSSAQKPADKPAKSSTRQLREKKPK